MTGPRFRLGRFVSWTVAVVALAFVAWIIPIRDRCYDPLAPTSTRAAISRNAAGCTLYLHSGEVEIPSAECDRLVCEPGVVTTFGHARLGVLSFLLALYGFGTWFWAARWRALLSFAGLELRTTEVWRLTIEAQAGGVLLPGGVGGDAFRVAGVLARPVRPGQARAPVSIVVASVMLDRAIGLSLIAAFAAVMGLASGGASRPLVATLAGIPLMFAAALGALRQSWAISALSSSVRLRRIFEPVLVYLRHPLALRAIAVATGFGLVNAAVQFVVIRGLVFALGYTPSTEGWVYVGTAMAFIVAAIPALPGGWGTADAAYVFFFGFAGLPKGVALAVSLLFRLFWYISAVVGAILHLSGARPPTGLRAST